MKTIKFLSALAVSSILAMSAVSCGGSGNDDPIEDDKPTSAKVEFSIEISEDLLSVANVVISYADANNSAQSVTMTETTWDGSVTKTTFPCEFSGFTVNYSLKDGVELTKDRYTIARTIQEIIYVDGDKKRSGGIPKASQGIATDKLADYLEGQSGRTFGRYRVAADGTITEL